MYERVADRSRDARAFLPPSLLSPSPARHSASVKSTRSRDDAEKLAGAPDKLQHVGDGASSYDESLESRAAAEGIDAVFLAKVQVINRGLADCGFGRYQWQLFFSAGFGWVRPPLPHRRSSLHCPSAAPSTVRRIERAGRLSSRAAKHS